MHFQRLTSSIAAFFFVAASIYADEIASAPSISNSSSKQGLSATSKWYAIYDDANRFWDSTNNYVELHHVYGGVTAVSLLGDKGKRFGFPFGIQGSQEHTPIRCQAHADHWVRRVYTNYPDSIVLHSKDDNGDSDLYLWTNGTRLWLGIDGMGNGITWSLTSWNIAEVSPGFS